MKESGIGVYFLTHTRSRVTPLHLNLHLRISVATSVVSRIFIAATPTCSARCESSARSRRQTRNRLLNMAMGEEKTKIEEGGQKDSSEKTWYLSLLFRGAIYSQGGELPSRCTLNNKKNSTRATSDTTARIVRDSAKHATLRGFFFVRP